ncbi:hypothetical protein ACT1U9_11680 [Streptomyces sp. BR1]|uniref:hypothetical protein n=1 Tax=Streptomyces sp. BR1 TaxID=1592323 RepID=UPI00402BF444
MSTRGGGGAHWNDETQSWEQGEPPPRRYSAPVPPPPPAPPPFGPPVPPHETPSYESPSYAYEGETQAGYELPRGPVHSPYAPADPVWRQRQQQRQRLVVAAVAAVVLAGGAVGGWMLWGRDGGSGSGAVSSASASQSPPPDGTTDAPTDTPSATPTDGATYGSTDQPTDRATYSSTDEPTPSPSASRAAIPVPGGYHPVTDTLGWSVAVRDGWTRTEERGSALYRSPDQADLLQVYRLTEPGITPYNALSITSGDLAGNPGYQQISLRRMTEVTRTDEAELVYAYDRTSTGVRVQGVARAFVAANGVPYTVLVSGPTADWPALTAVLDAALGAFTPR